MKRIFASLLVCSLVIFTISSGSVSAAPKQAASPQTTTLGYDISYPQCTKQIATTPAFTIVGVNGGKASTPNPCLDKQLSWAQNSTGKITAQDKVQLYVNTASPGEYIKDIDTWPANNIGPNGVATDNPYGLCNGTDTAACAWQYGWNRAAADANVYFKEAAGRAGVNDNPADYYWWLDVEILNTWQPGSKPDGHKKNVASLEGMTSYFTSLGTTEKPVRVGLYSTSYQWGQITGNAIGPASPLQKRDTWYALGSTTLAHAKTACTAQKPLVDGSRIVLTQFISKNLDHNYACS